MKKINYNTRTYIHKSGRVMVRVRWNKTKSEATFSTGTSAEPGKWSEEKSRAKQNTTHVVNGKTYSYREINGSIDTIQDFISETFYEFEKNNRLPDTEEFKEIVNEKIDELFKTESKELVQEGEDVDHLYLSQLLSAFQRIRPTEVYWGPKAGLRYKEVCDKYFRFCKKNDVKLMDINKSSLIRFKVWFLDPTEHKRPYSNYTVMKHFRNLKGMLRWGRDNGFNVNKEALLFNSNIQTIRKTVTFLEYDEIQKFSEYKFKDYQKHLEQVRDVFVFSCYTSLRHSDLYALRKANIKGDAIEIVTQKTKDLLHIPLIPQAKAILDKYKDIEGERALPVISDQKSNEYIKEAAKLAGLDRDIYEVRMVGNQRMDIVNKLYETISMHDGRRSFVCNSLAFGIPPNVVQKCTGHSDIQTMRPYIATSDKSVEKEMKKWNTMPIRQKIDALLDEGNEDELKKVYTSISKIIKR